jgi:hypothetical protein
MVGRDFRPAGEKQPERRMSSAAAAFEEVEAVRGLVIRAEDFEALRVGSIERARPRIARELGVNPSKLETLRRGRLKGVPGWLRDRIARLVMNQIQAEIARLTHEEQLVRQIGGNARDGDLQEIEASLAALRALIRGRT